MNSMYSFLLYFAKSFVLYHAYKPLKLYLKEFLAGHAVAMVAYCVTEIITMISIGHV